MKRVPILIFAGMALVLVGRLAPTPYGVLLEVIGIGLVYSAFWWSNERDLRNALIAFFLSSILFSIVAWIGSAP